MKYKEENVFKRTNERMNKRDKHMIKSMRIHTHTQARTRNYIERIIKDEKINLSQLNLNRFILSICW